MGTLADAVARKLGREPEGTVTEDETEAIFEAIKRINYRLEGVFLEVAKRHGSRDTRDVLHAAELKAPEVLKDLIDQLPPRVARQLLEADRVGQEFTMPGNRSQAEPAPAGTPMMGGAAPDSDEKVLEDLIAAAQRDPQAARSLRDAMMALAQLNPQEQEGRGSAVMRIIHGDPGYEVNQNGDLLAVSRLQSVINTMENRNDPNSLGSRADRLAAAEQQLTAAKAAGDRALPMAVSAGEQDGRDPQIVPPHEQQAHQAYLRDLRELARQLGVRLP